MWTVKLLNGHAHAVDIIRGDLSCVSRADAAFQLAEPLVMLATVVQWLVLSIAVGALVGVGCTVFLRVLFATAGRAYAAPLWLQMMLLPVGGFADGLLLHYGYKLRRSTFNDNAIVAVNEQHGKLPFRTMWIKPVAALITLGCGGAIAAGGSAAVLHVRRPPHSIADSHRRGVGVGEHGRPRKCASVIRRTD